MYIKQVLLFVILGMLWGVALSQASDFPTPNLLVAPYSEQLPTVDGNIDELEWQDAQVYRFPSAGRIVRLFLKHIKLEPNGTQEGCVLYPTNPDYLVPCGRYLVLAFQGMVPGWIYFDEGNDGARGSGRRDYVLTAGQEDLKVWAIYSRTDLSGQIIPSCDHLYGRVIGCRMPNGTQGCAPWSAEPCWTCDNSISRPVCRWSEDASITAIPTLLDVYVPGDGHYAGSGHWRGDALAYIAQYAEDLSSVEYLIPFFGDSACDRTPCSNINFDVGDEIGFRVPWLFPQDSNGDPTSWGGILLLDSILAPTKAKQ